MKICCICGKKHILIKIKLPKFKFVSGTCKALSYSKTYSICPNTQFLYTNTNLNWTKNLKEFIQIINLVLMVLIKVNQLGGNNREK